MVRPYEKMSSSVIETNSYKLQAEKLQKDKVLTAIQRQAIITFLAHYQFEGEELTVGKFDIFTLLWDPDKNLRVTYLVVQEDFTVFLLSITQGDVEFESTQADQKEQFAKQLGIGISTKLIAEYLSTVVTGWFGP